MEHRNTILNLVADIAYQPYLIFATQLEERPDNTIATLHLLSQEENVTAGRISEFLDIRPSSVTQIINKLETADMAERVRSQHDARVVFVRLTEKGQHSAGERGTISSILVDKIFEGFSENDLELLENALTKLRANFASDSFQTTVNEMFGDDSRWKHLSQMSAHFARARRHMMMRSEFLAAQHGGHNPFHGEGHGDDGWYGAGGERFRNDSGCFGGRGRQ